MAEHYIRLVYRDPIHIRQFDGVKREDGYFTMGYQASLNKQAARGKISFSGTGRHPMCSFENRIPSLLEAFEIMTGATYADNLYFDGVHLSREDMEKPINSDEFRGTHFIMAVYI